MADIFKDLEVNELLEKLRCGGYGDFIDAFLLNENKVYTKKGRLNKSGACRVLEYKPKQLEDIMQKCRDMLQPDLVDYDLIDEQNKLKEQQEADDTRRLEDAALANELILNKS